MDWLRVFISNKCWILIHMITETHVNPYFHRGPHALYFLKCFPLFFEVFSVLSFFLLRLIEPDSVQKSCIHWPVWHPLLLFWLTKENTEHLGRFLVGCSFVHQAYYVIFNYECKVSRVDKARFIFFYALE